MCNASSNFIYKMFRQKDVKVNGKKEKIDYILKENDVVSIYLKEDLYNKFFFDIASIFLFIKKILKPNLD